jgi:DNA-binding MarR family transcriptional regulator
MPREPSDEIVLAWARLVRVEQLLLDRIEAELKSAGFPPLAWYDVLLELSRAEAGELRPFELEQHMLLAQYNASRLIDRMAKAGLVRRRDCPEDRRGQVVTITDKGRALQRRMWRTYAAALSKHVGTKLTPLQGLQLADLLDKLA